MTSSTNTVFPSLNGGILILIIAKSTRSLNAIISDVSLQHFETLMLALLFSASKALFKTSMIKSSFSIMR